jgi:hypothetical protein
MSSTNEGIGWLPVEARTALEDEKDKASLGQAEHLLALDSRARVLALLERATCRNTEDQECPPLRPADLRRVLESFPGETPVDETVLMQRFATMIEPPT